MTTETIRTFDAHPLFPGKICLSSRFSDLGTFPIVEVSLPKILELVRKNPFLSSNQPMFHSQKNLLARRLQESGAVPVSIPWLTLAVHRPYCFVSGFEVDFRDDLRLPRNTDELWPNRDTIVAVMKDGLWLMEHLEQLQVESIPVHVPSWQRSLIRRLASGSSESELVPLSSINDE